MRYPKKKLLKEIEDTEEMIVYYRAYSDELYLALADLNKGPKHFKNMMVENETCVMERARNDALRFIVRSYATNIIEQVVNGELALAQG